jgi:hypothetical protein
LQHNAKYAAAAARNAKKNPRGSAITRIDQSIHRMHRSFFSIAKKIPKQAVQRKRSRSGNTFVFGEVVVGVDSLGARVFRKNWIELDLNSRINRDALIVVQTIAWITIGA